MIESTRGAPLAFFFSNDGEAAVRLIPVINDEKICSYYLQVHDGKKGAEVNLTLDKLHGLAERLYSAVKP